jgi:hypothetical protein
MNRLFLFLIAGFAAVSIAGASFASPFSTEIRSELTTDAYGYNVNTISYATDSSATTSVATVHDDTLIWAPTNLKGQVWHVNTKARGYDSHACASFGSVGNPTFCEPPRGR